MSQGLNLGTLAGKLLGVLASDWLVSYKEYWPLIGW